jgi:hypothetical protein
MNRIPSSKTLLFLALLSLAAVALLAGCGGQGGQTGGTATDSTQALAGGEPAPGGEATAPPAEGGTPAGGSTAGKAAPPGPRTGTLAAGTELVGALQQTIATDKSKVGDPVTLSTVDAIAIGGGVTIPAGSTIKGEVTHVKGAGRLAGGAELTLRFVELVLQDGTSVPITCDPFRLVGKGDSKETALEIGGGAAAGALLGGVIGGKDDIAKGAAAGAIVGTGIAVATRGNQIVLPVGQKVNVKVTAPAAVTVKPTAS